MEGRKPISSSWSASSSTCGTKKREPYKRERSGTDGNRGGVQQGDVKAGKGAFGGPSTLRGACSRAARQAAPSSSSGQGQAGSRKTGAAHDRQAAWRTRVRMPCSAAASPEFSRWSIRRPGVATSTSHRPCSRLRSLRTVGTGAQPA
jgi:hypothetical protein